MTENQIDHVAINSKWKSSLQDVRVKRSVDAESAHHPAVAEIKMRLLAVKRTRCTKTWYDIMKLRDRDTYDAFVYSYLTDTKPCAVRTLQNKI